MREVDSQHSLLSTQYSVLSTPSSAAPDACTLGLICNPQSAIRNSAALIATFFILAGAALADDVPGNRLVAAAARRVHDQSSLSADLRYRIDAFGHELAGQGSYHQLGAASEKLLKLELKIQVADQQIIRQEICGPSFYYVRRESPFAPVSLGRVNLRQVRQAIARAEGPIAANPAEVWILLGGLPKLLESLHRNFEFAPPRDDELHYTVTGGEGVQKLPVIVVRGRWKKDRLATLMTTDKGKSKDDAEQLPDAVELVLGRADDTALPLFPYRITYLQDVQTEAQDKQGKEANQLRAMLLLELFNVQRSNLTPEQFDYQPSERDEADLTQAYLVRLGLAKPR
jgi:hypothetical protein